MVAMEIIAMSDVARLSTTLLLAFDALMSERNVTRAAARIGLTQQGLSGQLRRMRALFDDPLFVRDGGGVAPTRRAEELHQRIKRALASLEGLLAPAVFDPSKSADTITLAASDYAQAAVLPALFPRVRATAPLLRIAVHALNTATLGDDLRHRRIDVALTVPEFAPPGGHTRRLFRERYLVAVRRGHPLARRPRDLDAFCTYEHLLVAPNRGDFSGPTDAALQRLGRQRRVGMVLPSFTVARSLLESTDLVAVLPERTLLSAGPELRVFEPPLRIEGFDLVAVWPDRIHADPLHRWFRGLCFEGSERQ
jgi:DNA-binding transcriptional LysR family regulator